MEIINTIVALVFIFLFFYLSVYKFAKFLFNKFRKNKSLSEKKNRKITAVLWTVLILLFVYIAIQSDNGQKKKVGIQPSIETPAVNISPIQEKNISVLEKKKEINSKKTIKPEEESSNFWWYVFILFVLAAIGSLFNEKSNNNKSKTRTPKNQPPKREQIISTVQFKYRDYNDIETERTVDLTSGKKGDKFKGYCHLRKEMRTFYFSRIANYEIIDIDTGEIMTPMQWKYDLQGTRIAKEAMNDERRLMEYERKRIEANNTWLKPTKPEPIVEFKNKRFALGGYFKSGNIDESKEKVEKRGGIIQPSPNGKTDYIVVNPEHGVNKTYKTAILKLLERGINPVIISEEHWLRYFKQTNKES